MKQNNLVILIDTSGNNPVIAKRIYRKGGHYYFPFPIVDKDGNEITEEQASRNDTKSINSRGNMRQK